MWYYFDIQFRQIFRYWVLGIIIGSVISVFAKDKIHRLFERMNGKKMGIFGVIPASLLGIASPLCMYGTIPIAASFANKGMRQDWLADGMSLGNAAAFMITGPATKITNLGAVKIVLGLKRFVLYLLFVMVFAMLTGIVTNLWCIYE